MDLGRLVTRPFKPNLTKEEKAAARRLQQADLVIRNADKGSCLVVESVSHYIEDGENHLSRSIYKPLPKDPTHKLVEAVNSLSDRLHKKGLITLGYEGVPYPQGRHQNTANVLSEEAAQGSQGGEAYRLRFRWP